MKKTILKISTFLASISLLFMASCGPSQVKLTVDNPTNRDISISIDDQAPMSIKQNSKTPLTLLEGKHTLKMDDKVQEFELKGFDLGILNPTGSHYINETIKYAYSPSIAKLNSESDPKSDEFILDIIADDSAAIQSSKHWGSFNIENTLVIPRNWDFDLDTKAYKEVKTSSTTETRRKIYRYKDLRTKLIEDVKEELNKDSEKKYTKEDVVQYIKLMQMMKMLKDTTKTKGDKDLPF
jgi:hypothetical protein